MRVDERGEGDRDQRELAERGAAADAHQAVVADAGAPERHDGLSERRAEREDQREMADLDDHVWPPSSPSCQRPCFFSASTTSRGI